MQLIYTGDHREVLVPVTASFSLTCSWGVPCEVPDELAASLLESAAWMQSKKSTKKAAAQADAHIESKGETDGSR